MVAIPDRVVKGLIISGFAAGATATGGAIFAAEGVAVLVAYLNTKHGEQLVREINKGEEEITRESRKKKRRPNAANRAYSIAFKKVEHKYKKKGGGWKKDGFKNAGAAARRLVKKG